MSEKVQKGLLLHRRKHGQCGGQGEAQQREAGGGGYKKECMKYLAWRLIL